MINWSITQPTRSERGNPHDRVAEELCGKVKNKMAEIERNYHLRADETLLSSLKIREGVPRRHVRQVYS